MKVLVVPARGGSKRIPRKNVKPFLGQPVLTRTLKVALESGSFDRVIVSTDDPEIAALALSVGAEVPFERPASLADDHTTTRDVISHAIERLSDDRSTPTIVGCLYPTAVFATSDHLKQGINVLRDDATASIVVTVGEYPRSVLRSLVERDGRVHAALPEYRQMRTQDLPAVYFDAGQFYLGRAARWTDLTTPLLASAVPIVVPGVIDIDTERDWAHAEQEISCRSD